MRLKLAVLAVLLITAGTAWAGQVSLDSLPPVVVSTVPRAGDQVVDPALTEIRVTFSKPMNTQNSWSWVMVSPESFPKIAGRVRFLPDGRTCVAPVYLKPGTSYAIWLNSAKHRGFQDKAGTPAIPYLLGFKTR